MVEKLACLADSKTTSFFTKCENKEGTAVITDAESAVKCSERKEETFIPFHYKSTLNSASPVSALVASLSRLS